jgi:hypothetical protein
LEGTQRLCLSVAGREGLDEHCPPALVQRFGDDERVGGRHRLVGPAGCQEGGGVRFLGRHPPLLQPARFGTHARHVGAVAERRPAPQVEPGAEQLGRLGRGRVPRRVHERLELVGV